MRSERLFPGPNIVHLLLIIWASDTYELDRAGSSSAITPAAALMEGSVGSLALSVWRQNVPCSKSHIIQSTYTATCPC